MEVEVVGVFKDTKNVSEREVKNRTERQRDMLDRQRRLNVSFRIRRRNRMQKIKYLRMYWRDISTFEASQAILDLIRTTVLGEQVKGKILQIGENCTTTKDKRGAQVAHDLRLVNC